MSKTTNDHLQKLLAQLEADHERSAQLAQRRREYEGFEHRWEAQQRLVRQTLEDAGILNRWSAGAPQNEWVEGQVAALRSAVKVLAPYRHLLTEFTHPDEDQPGHRRVAVLLGLGFRGEWARVREVFRQLIGGEGIIDRLQETATRFGELREDVGKVLARCRRLERRRDFPDYPELYPNAWDADQQIDEVGDIVEPPKTVGELLGYVEDRTRKAHRLQEAQLRYAGHPAAWDRIEWLLRTDGAIHLGQFHGAEELHDQLKRTKGPDWGIGDLRLLVEVLESGHTDCLRDVRNWSIQELNDVLRRLPDYRQPGEGNGETGATEAKGQPDPRLNANAGSRCYLEIEKGWVRVGGFGEVGAFELRLHTGLRDIAELVQHPYSPIKYTRLHALRTRGVGGDGRSDDSRRAGKQLKREELSSAAGLREGGELPLEVTSKEALKEVRSEVAKLQADRERLDRERRDHLAKVDDESELNNDEKAFDELNKAEDKRKQIEEIDRIINKIREYVRSGSRPGGEVAARRKEDRARIATTQRIGRTVKKLEHAGCKLLANHFDESIGPDGTGTAHKYEPKKPAPAWEVVLRDA